MPNDGSRIALWRAVAVLFVCAGSLGLAADREQVRPTMGEFIGLNGHTVQFKADLYAKVCRQVRDYHSLAWDLGKETDYVPKFPEARNRVNWNTVYGSWQKAAFTTDVCLMFNNTPPDGWKDLPRDARAYGQAFATAFGPSSAKKLVSAAEIGNEPGNYSDEQYRRLFAAMAAGLRAGDPQLKIATCNLVVGKSGKYAKSVECVQGLESLYDILNIHTYAMAEHWPTWKRSYPEDPKIDFLKTVQALIDWRDRHAAGKEVWVTEFGWDATTKPNKTNGDFAKWQGNVSDERQAQYLVRALLVFSSLDVRKAFLYFFNDADEPSFHAASGITRNFQPKPSFYAVGHLTRTLGEYRFRRVIAQQASEVYAFEYEHARDAKKRIVVAWSPTGSGDKREVEMAVGSGKIVQAEKMPLSDQPAERLSVAPVSQKVRLTVDESPVYLVLEE